MPFKIFTILILVCQTCCKCFSQIPINQQSFRPAVATTIISHYDTLLPPINFEFVNHTDGLPKGNIKSVVQTDDGYLWISIWNYGLVRYDGYSFLSFLTIAGDSTSMPTRKIINIIKSEKNGLWFVSDVGLCWFDLKTYHTKIIKDLPRNVFEVMGNWGCIEDKLGQLWVFGKGLFLYNPFKHTFKEISKNSCFDNFTGKPIDITRYFFNKMTCKTTLSADGSFWISGSVTNEGTSLFHVNPKTKEIKYYPPFYKFSHRELGILPDPDSCHIWVSVAGSAGIFKYNFSKDSLRYITFEKEAKGNVRDYTLLSHIENGNLWMISPNAIKVMNVQNFQTQYYKNKQSRPAYFMGMTQGLNLNRWLWNSNNELICNFSEKQRFTYYKILPEGENVTSYWKDEKNNIEWFGTEGTDKKIKIFKYDVASRKLIFFSLPPSSGGIFFLSGVNDNELLLATGSYNILQQRDKSLFISGLETPLYMKYESKPDKLFLFNIRSSSFKTISQKISNHKSFTTDSFTYLNSVCRDIENNFWFSFGNGLLKYDPAINKFYSANAANPFIDETQSILISNGQSYIWSGAEAGVLKKIDVKTFEVEKFIVTMGSFFASPLCEDLQGNVYLEINKEIVVFNAVSKKTSKVPYLPGEIYKAVVDSANNIIALAEDGLWFYNTTLKTARKFDGKDGLKEWDILNQANKSEILINDYYRFPVRFLYPKNIVAPLHLSSIKIFGKKLAATDNVDTLQNLILRHNENQITLEFVSLSFLANKENSYACMLQSSDTGWQSLGTQNSITYANLAPGEYIFKVKTANKDNIWGEERVLHIQVLPPWYLTWWAYGLYGIFFGAILWRFIKLRVRAIEKEKIFLQEKLKMQHAVMTERLRISRELHDEVGATLSGIAMYSHLTKEQIKNSNTSEVEKSLNIMQQSAGEMVNKLNDIVWLINPDQDSLQKLIQRLEEYAMDMAMIKDMQVKITVPENIYETLLPMESRRNIYLFCKEAINNSVKYSNGTLLELRIKETEGILEFSVSDNGKGFDAIMVRRGNGLENMQKRADEIGARLLLQSKQHEGAMVSMQIKIT